MVGPYFLQLDAGDRVQTEACHVFVQCGNGLGCGGVFRIAHAVTQFIEEVVTGHFQSVCNIDGAMGTAVIAVDPAARPGGTGVFEYPFVRDDGGRGDGAGFPDLQWQKPF